MATSLERAFLRHRRAGMRHPNSVLNQSPQEPVTRLLVICVGLRLARVFVFRMAAIVPPTVVTPQGASVRVPVITMPLHGRGGIGGRRFGEVSGGDPHVDGSGYE